MSLCCSRVCRSVGNFASYMYYGVDKAAVRELTRQALQDLRSSSEPRQRLVQWALDIYKTHNYNPEFEAFTIQDVESAKKADRLFDPIIRDALTNEFRDYPAAGVLLQEAGVRPVIELAVKEITKKKES